MRETPQKNSGIFELLKRIPFRQHGTVYLTLAVLIAVVATVLYLLSGVLDWLDVPPETMQISTCETGVGCYTTGYIVRREQVLTSACPMINLTLTEGQKAAAGQTVAVGYTTNDARQKQSQIAQLESRLRQLQFAGSGSAVYDQATMDAEIRRRLTEMAQLKGRGDLISVSDMATELKGLVLRGTADEATVAAMGEKISELQDSIFALRSQASGQTETVVAPTAGYFSGTVDGFETVLTPERMQTVSVTELEQLAPEAQPAGALGKIVSDDVWYYVTAVPAASAAQMKKGSTVQVSFAHDIGQVLDMKITRIGEEENGKNVVVMSANHFLQEVTMLRNQSADVVVQTYAGLRVPKKAVRVQEDGKVGVFVLETTNAKWKPVTILHDSGESYVVELDKSSTGNLWPGDEILLNAEELYDGKVVILQ